MSGPEFLNKKYPDLPGSRPVERAVQNAKRDPERQFAPHSREERIQAYLDRLDHTVQDERGWDLLKSKLIKEFVIDTDDTDTLEKIAHGLYESEKRLAIEQGRGADIRELVSKTDIVEQYKMLVHEKHDIQERTFEAWLNYLQQNDAEYPTWFRYFAVRNLQKMGSLDKEKGEYSKRSDYTIAPFPELNSEALGFVYRMLTTGIGHQEYVSNPNDTPELIAQKQKKRDELTKLISKKDFVRLYAFAQIETAGQLDRESLQGEWVKYERCSDHNELEGALRGKGTGWCTAEGSAYSQLQGGDFYVYYTRGKSGTYSEPRIAIRMEGESVAEVRGVNHRQELEPALVDIATEKYHALPGGEKFDKKSADMKQLTDIEDKMRSHVELTRDELVFLYELNGSIEGFGYEKDPRVEELRSRRNALEDAPVVFGCEPEEIAWKPDDINYRTKAYVGPLIGFGKLRYLEHVYTSFPEGKIDRRSLEIGGKTKGELKKGLERRGIQISRDANFMLESKDFTTLKNRESIDLVRLTVSDLGFPRGATTEEIYARAAGFGLELCPAETGAHLRLQYTDQPLDDWAAIAMKQINDSDGYPGVFSVYRDDDGLWLDLHWTRPGDRWNADGSFVFRLRALPS